MIRRGTKADRQHAEGAPLSEPALHSPAAWTERRFGLILTGFCLVSLLFRLVILREYLAKNPLALTPINDAETYWDWAGRIAGGQLTQDTPFFSAPLYPYLLGLLRALGGGLRAIYGLQILADLGTACLLALVGRGRFGAGVGLLAAGLFLLLQEPASFALRMLPSSLQLLLVTVTWALLVKVQTQPSLGYRSALGAVVGLLCLADATALLLVIIIGLWLFYLTARRVRDAGRAAVPVATAALMILPATLHNWRACGELFLVRSGSGITLRHGNQPESIGAYTTIAGISTKREQMHEDAVHAYQKATGEQPTWKKLDRYYRDQVLHDWWADPLRALRLAARKLYWFVSSRNYGDIYQPRAEIARGLDRRLWLAPLPVAWLMGPALVGLVLLRRHPVRPAPEWMLFGVPLVAVAVFFYSPRYRIPAVPIVAVTAAWALERALHWRRHWRHALAVGTALSAGILLGTLNRVVRFDPWDPAALSFQLAYALKEQGKVEAAVEQQRAGLQARPHDARAHIYLGDLLSDLGGVDEALVEYQRAAELHSDDAELFRKMGKLFSKRRRFPEAEAALARAVELEPTNAALLSRLAAVKQILGDARQARELYEKALTLTPEDAEIRALYGGLLVDLGEWARARAEFSGLVQRSPDNPEAHYYLGVIAGQLGDFAQARTAFERALELQPRSVKTLHALGVLNVKQDRLEEAAECFRKALAVDPADEVCRTALRQVEQAQAARSSPRP